MCFHTRCIEKKKPLWLEGILSLNFLFGSNHDTFLQFPTSTTFNLSPIWGHQANTIKFWLASFNGIIIDNFIERLIYGHGIQHFHCQEFWLFPGWKQLSWVWGCEMLAAVYLTNRPFEANFRPDTAYPNAIAFLSLGKCKGKTVWLAVLWQALMLRVENFPRDRFAFLLLKLENVSASEIVLPSKRSIAIFIFWHGFWGGGSPHFSQTHFNGKTSWRKASLNTKQIQMAKLDKNLWRKIVPGNFSMLH